MKTAAKTTLNSMEEVLLEINTLIEQQEKEDYAKIFMVRRNLSLTYESNYYLEIMNVTTTIGSRTNVWNAEVTL
ncbi:hypothetical protein EMA8858_00370 [Emticicia aquatica]|jgi:glutaredoxin 2|uniref:Uncharacterized protein n=1 Tax=Emticicia aquatica TaxID=1681835 RepID=A0ABN8EN22_9BACT|nr:hypothetical protein [Emticicia aquatica]CAH0994261.1 hypothetical protein EMA8858_00370 [Emticicia aquatica]